MTLALCENFLASVAGNTNNSATITPQLAQWMRDCPDLALFQTAMKDYICLNTVTKCATCGEKYKTKDLRYDVADPCGDPLSLVCRNCWDLWNGGSLGDPQYRPPQWPETLNLNDKPAPLINGIIVDRRTNAVIGRAKRYNPRGHFAELVTLFGFEENAEGGSLDPDCFVIAENSTALDTVEDDVDTDSDEGEEEEEDQNDDQD
jgi:hypothetical protein